MKTKDYIKDFWEQKEKELNSKLIIATSAECIKGNKDLTNNMYGLLYLMDNGLYFENFENNNLIKSLVYHNRDSKFNKIFIDFPVDDIEEISDYSGNKSYEEQSFFDRLKITFGISPRVILIKMKNQEKLVFRPVDDPLKITEAFYNLRK